MATSVTVIPNSPAKQLDWKKFGPKRAKCKTQESFSPIKGNHVSPNVLKTYFTLFP